MNLQLNQYEKVVRTTKHENDKIAGENEILKSKKTTIITTNRNKIKTKTAKKLFEKKNKHKDMIDYISDRM